MKKTLSFCFSLLLFLSIIIAPQGRTVLAASKDTVEEQLLSDDDYSNYYKKCSEQKSASSEIAADLSIAAVQNGVLVPTFENKTNVVKLERNGKVEFDIAVTETGLYNLTQDYFTLLGNNRDYQFALYIDNKLPYKQAEFLNCCKYWRDTNYHDPRFKLDKSGNEITPEQQEVKVWQSAVMRDEDGYFLDPYVFYLEKGQHHIKLEFGQGDIAISRIAFTAPVKLPSYDAYQQQMSGKKDDATSHCQLINAEKTTGKSDPSLLPSFDRTSPSTMPESSDKIVLNTIGGSTWHYTGQWMEWDFEVPKDGFYTISLRARQNIVRGVSVSRRIYIDGQVPFEELNNYRFDFNAKWYTEQLGNKNGAFEIYLVKGQKHTIRMEISPAYPKIVLHLQEILTKLNDVYREIIMITSPNPDLYRDYQLDRKIPDFKKKYQALIDEINSVLNDMEKSGFQKGSEAVIVEQIRDQLNDFLKKPISIPNRLTEYKSSLSSVGQWVYRLKEQPLELDYIEICSKDQAPQPTKDNLFTLFGYHFKVFLSSFFNDYSSLDSDYAEGQALDVWVCTYGRDQAQTIKRLVDNEFIPKYGVPVNVNLVQMGIIPATLTGEGPDIALFLSPQNEIINLAARDALVDLSQFDGFNEVSERFHDDSLTPYRYLDGVYGIPLVEDFYMMFIRDDIFADFNLSAPKTWDDFYKVLGVLQRNNLTTGVPSTNTVMMSLFNDLMFQTLLYQHGGEYYTKNWSSTGFDTSAALQAFNQWTEFYTKYSLEVEFDPFSRFRIGEMPLIIASYAMYNQLNIAAPEIRGLWSMHTIPGVLGANGKVNNAVAVNSNGVVMFKKTANKQAGWSFIKWFTSGEVQGKYGNEIETLLGPLGRYSTANIEAMQYLPWGNKEKEIIAKQWNQMVAIPQTPVSYYTTRQMANAFRRVVYDYANTRETLSMFNREINKEITRRRTELGLK